MSYLDFVYFSVFIISIASLFKRFFKSKDIPEDVKEKIKEFLSKSIGGNIILIIGSICWILFPIVNGFFYIFLINHSLKFCLTYGTVKFTRIT